MLNDLLTGSRFGMWILSNLLILCIHYLKLQWLPTSQSFPITETSLAPLYIFCVFAFVSGLGISILVAYKRTRSPKIGRKRSSSRHSDSRNRMSKISTIDRRKHSTSSSVGSTKSSLQVRYLNWRHVYMCVLASYCTCVLTSYKTFARAFRQDLAHFLV